jgi:hypothetical protein
MTKNKCCRHLPPTRGRYPAHMDLFCALFGHWPVPLASRRDRGRKVNRCWMCEDRIVADAGQWRSDDRMDARPVAERSPGARRLRVASAGACPPGQR